MHYDDRSGREESDRTIWTILSNIFADVVAKKVGLSAHGIICQSFL